MNNIIRYLLRLFYYKDIFFKEIIFTLNLFHILYLS